MSEFNLVLSDPQDTFLNGLQTKFRAYVGGFGSGKTFVGCLDLLYFAMKYPGVKQGYFGVNYGAIRDIFYPTFEEAASIFGFKCHTVESNKEIHFYRNGFYYGTIICRSMDNPDTIIGFKIARALVDEIDTLKNEKAAKAWNKIIARLRLLIPGVVNGIGVTTTPEGFKFVYEKFAKNPTESYSMVQASTYENQAHLPEDYISSLYETYPANLVEAYINGQFVNLESGSVYREFCRFKNASTEIATANDDLYIGMDFNVQKMSAVIHVLRDGNPHAVDEVTGAYDTPDMIEKIQMRYPHNRIFVYPDGSGKNRKSVNASDSDIKLLKRAGFRVRARSANPLVRSRINCVNAMICNAKGERRYFVNVEKCPVTTEALEHQVYDDRGEPDKEHDQDHPNDAIGYYLSYEFPIVKKIATAW